MSVFVCIACATLGYFVGLHVGKKLIKTSCPGIIKMARDEEDKGFYFALEVKGKEAIKEMYESDTVTFNVRRMPETQIKQGL